MRYDDARPLIQTGDVLCFETRSLGAWFVRLAQRIAGLRGADGMQHWRTSHVAIAWWIGGRLFAVGMDGSTNALVPLSHYRDYRVTVHRTGADFDPWWDAMTRDALHYRYDEILLIGLRLVTGLDLGDTNDRPEVCSSWVARWLATAGKPLLGLYGLPGPSEVQALLPAPVVEIDP